MADTTPTDPDPVAITVITSSTPSSRASARRAERRRLGVPEIDTRPRPLRQALWILASVALVGLVLLSAADRIGQAGAAATAGLEAAELLELADQQPSPAAPTAAETGGTSETTPSEESNDSMAGATTLPLPEHVAVGRAALAEISYPWERTLPEWTIEFHPARDGLYGLTLVPEQRIEVYVRPDQSPGMVAHVIAHELGHAVDVSLNDGEDRNRWTAARGLDDAPWWPESGATDFSTGAGDFAESFAAWQVGPNGFRSTLAPAPDGAQIELLAELSAS